MLRLMLNKSMDASKPRRGDLTVVWCNVRKSVGTHGALLSLCADRKADVIHVTEPWVGPQSPTQNHPAFQSNASVVEWEMRADDPRVMSYVRNEPHLATCQRRPEESGDRLWSEVNGHLMLNVYWPLLREVQLA